jgi:hypothetical protein
MVLWEPNIVRLKMKTAAAALFVCLLLGGCGPIDTTPADIHQRLIPKIANDILTRGESALLRQQPQNYLSVLSPTSAVRYEPRITAGLEGEAGITFFRMPENTPILALSFDLHEDMQSYNFGQAKEPNDEQNGAGNGGSAPARTQPHEPIAPGL